MLLTEPVFAQDNVKNLLLIEPDKTVYTIVEKQPEFPGGMRAMENYLLTTVRYPAEAKKAGIIGRVFVSFIVEIDGRITGVERLNGLGFGCDEEAIRVINAMPRWTPGSQSGRPLRVKYRLPVLFGIDYPERKGH
ncbi:energy transducer TonB [Spirosoma validum]|uniref:energy transducer TonB n=1 Tax=Spirosoma validum TaxID=2771355 RepID=UPI001CC32B3B|nr:energy transducer TonB [Spirosoma validum]